MKINRQIQFLDDFEFENCSLTVRRNASQMWKNKKTIELNECESEHLSESLSSINTNLCAMNMVLFQSNVFRFIRAWHSLMKSPDLSARVSFEMANIVYFSSHFFSFASFVVGL